MNTAFDFIKDSHIFHLATVDGAEARVRPFGFIMKRNRTMYFCTNKTKDVYKQLCQNPDIEISCLGLYLRTNRARDALYKELFQDAKIEVADTAEGATWLRIRGRISFDESREAKAQVFEEVPDLLKVYPKGADDELFVTFYFTEAEATMFSFTEAPKIIPLA